MHHTKISHYTVVVLVEPMNQQDIIMESVDSEAISRDGPDIAIYIIHYKDINNSEQLKF